MTPADVVARLSADPRGAALVCDFDGTLCDIVEDPATSRMPTATALALEQLAARLGAVAVVSGRPAAFLGQRAAVPGVRLLGLYGLEEWVGGRTVPRPEAAAWADAVGRARAELSAVLAGDADLRLEDKGLAVAVHWRGARDYDAAGARALELVTRLAASTGLAREPGKLVEELRPPVAWDKGRTVALLAEEADCSVLAYLGDDLGDLPAFAAARDLGGLAVAVDHGHETPAQVRTAADLVVEGPAGAAALLTDLAAAVS